MNSSDRRSDVLVMVPGVMGSAPDGAEAFHLAAIDSPQLLVTDFVATRGDGVFETLGAFDGTLVNVRPHLERLTRSAAMIDLPAPDLEVLTAALDAAVAAHEPVRELTVRLSLTRGVEGTDEPTCWIHARTAEDYAPARAGLRVITLDRGLSTTAPATSPWLLAGAKTLSYAVNMAVLREAQRRGAEEVLFVSSDGYALEGPTSTLLVQREDRFLTTPVSAGVLPGTSVTSAFDALRAMGRQCAEELLTPAQVKESQGAWLLSSGRLACPITHLDEAELPVDRELTARIGDAIAGRS
ncbi:aminotransferase class IV [Brachybacterium sp. UMB0905]|uniref:aminotransferase class IV n=1 Tax=Brachybacterium sp. UMB0905 TaxID=2069310 RepID=UPI000C8070F1|nr:aminotransferase class IV [Brachybacterium sp. UMB0905]PMC74874.1 aminodeoxychorismate lyase [Brachybacterium sp. UMB0905]